MIARFQFYDLNYNVTSDYQGGSPLIRVSIAVACQPVLQDVLALIDTGSNVTIIHPDVARNFTPVGTIPTQTAAGPIQVDQYGNGNNYGLRRDCRRGHKRTTNKASCDHWTRRATALSYDL
jgi:hypothetical protein